MADPTRAGHRWWGRRRAALGVTVVVVALVGGGAAAWAAESSGNSGFRTTKVVRASVSNDVALVGTVQPVNNASAGFQVGGKVTAVSATVGENVTVGQTLATLDTTALSEAVSSDQSTLAASEAKLTEDEDSQTSAATADATTTTTAPPHNTSTPNPSGAPSTDAAITADQNTLTKDEAQTFTDQQQEVADLAQARSACGVGSGPGSPTPSKPATTSTTTTTTTPANTGACTTDLEQVSNDQQQVSTDEATVAKDETSLAKALGDTSNGSSPSGTTGGVPSHALSNGIPSGSNSSSPSGNTGSTGANGAGNNSSAASDSPEQIATDQANIDTAKANLIEDQQSLAEATLTSPITGTVASVGLSAGNTVSAGSSTEVIVIIGTQSFEVGSTLSSSQVPDVKVGQPADIEVDGESDPYIGTVSQVGPVQSTSAGYSYPVVVTLPESARGLFAGSTATMTITTGGVRDVMAVPTSSVITNGSTHYVDMLKNGTITRHVVKIGMVGSIYTQITSGLKVGQSVVLADLAEPVPSSNADTLGGLGGGGFPAGGVFNIERVKGGPGGGVSVNIGG